MRKIRRVFLFLYIEGPDKKSLSLDTIKNRNVLSGIMVKKKKQTYGGLPFDYGLSGYIYQREITATHFIKSFEKH